MPFAITATIAGRPTTLYPMTRYDDNWLKSLLNKPGYSQPADPVATGICHPQPKQDAQLLPLGEDKDEERGTGSVRVRITCFRAKLLDPDNCAGAVKFLLDACRYDNLIPDDNPESITLEVCQVKVPKDERGTLIEITKL